MPFLMGQPSPDKLFKVFPFLQAVEHQTKSIAKNKICQLMNGWFQGTTINETVCASKRGETRNKIWEYAESSNSYTCNLQRYTGKKDSGMTEH